MFDLWSLGPIKSWARHGECWRTCDRDVGCVERDPVLVHGGRGEQRESVVGRDVGRRGGDSERHEPGQCAGGDDTAGVQRGEPGVDRTVGVCSGGGECLCVVCVRVVCAVR